MNIKGVNLGNWLVLEKWMSEEVFRGLKARDEEEFYDELPYQEAELRLYMHRSYFIQERDFLHIRSMGLNAVRIPVPHYIFGDQKRYPGCIDFLDKAFEWGQKYDLKILIDLHTVPDSQNGFDNGGLSGVVKWHQNQENISYTLSVIERLAKRYSGSRCLYGIELINEPVSEKYFKLITSRYPAKDRKRAAGSSAVPTELLKDFYQRGYDIVRRNCGADVKVVLHDGFRLEEWEDFMPEKEFKGVVIDTHMYLSGLEGEMPQRRLQDYETIISDHFRKRLQRAGNYHPVIVGEWCIANKCTERGKTDTDREIYRMIAAWEMQAWEVCEGWFFWNYKLHTAGRDDWDYGRAADLGYLNESGRDNEKRTD